MIKKKLGGNISMGTFLGFQSISLCLRQPLDVVPSYSPCKCSFGQSYFHFEQTNSLSLSLHQIVNQRLINVPFTIAGQFSYLFLLLLVYFTLTTVVLCSLHWLSFMLLHLELLVTHLLLSMANSKGQIGYALSNAFCFILHSCLPDLLIFFSNFFK